MHLSYSICIQICLHHNVRYTVLVNSRSQPTHICRRMCGVLFSLIQLIWDNVVTPVPLQYRQSAQPNSNLVRPHQHLMCCLPAFTVEWSFQFFAQSTAVYCRALCKILKWSVDWNWRHGRKRFHEIWDRWPILQQPPAWLWPVNHVARK